MRVAFRHSLLLCILGGGARGASLNTVPDGPSSSLFGFSYGLGSGCSVLLSLQFRETEKCAQSGIVRQDRGVEGQEESTGRGEGPQGPSVQSSQWVLCVRVPDLRGLCPGALTFPTPGCYLDP